MLVAAGRRSKRGCQGLDAAGLIPGERGDLKKTNSLPHCSVPHIYAIGDVIGFPHLHLRECSRRDGLMTSHLVSKRVCPPREHPYLGGLHNLPEVATAGRTEHWLRRHRDRLRGGPRPLHGQSARMHHRRTGRISKLISGRPDLKLIGVHAIGEMRERVGAHRFGGDDRWLRRDRLSSLSFNV